MGLFDTLNNMFECIQGTDVESIIEQQRRWSVETRIKNAIDGGGYTTSKTIVADLVVFDDDVSYLSKGDLQLSAKGRIIFALKSQATVSKVKFRSVDSRGDRTLVVVRAPGITFAECIFDGKNSRNALEANCPVTFNNSIIRNCGAKYNSRNVVEIVRREDGRRRSDVTMSNLKILRCMSDKSLFSVSDDLSGTCFVDKCTTGSDLFCAGGKMYISEMSA